MDYLEIQTATQALLAELSPGSSTFDSQYLKAIQWAQEQICTFMGLSYVEAFVAWSGVTGPTSEVVTTVVIPDDAISVVRVLYAMAPNYMDGGSASTSSWMGSVDGGSASTTLWAAYLDGGSSQTTTEINSVVGYP